MNRDDIQAENDNEIEYYEMLARREQDRDDYNHLGHKQPKGECIMRR